MSQKKESPQSQDRFVFLVVGLAIGAVVAYGAVKLFSGGGGDRPAPPPAPLSAPQTDVSETVDRLKGVVAADPNNYDAWVQLGNTYFDSNQPSLAAQAYEKALSLKGSSADVRTDLGIMYRELGRAQEALTQFQKALELDPRHFNSRLNIGVVQLYDLKNYRAALAAWEELQRLYPDDERSKQLQTQMQGLRQMVSQIDAGKTTPPGGAPGTGGEPAVPPGMGLGQGTGTGGGLPPVPQLPPGK